MYFFMELTPDYEAYKRLVLLRQQSHFLVEKIKRKIVQLTKVAFGKGQIIQGI